MGVTISYISRELTTGTVRVRGHDIAIRALTGAETDFALVVFPRPVSTKLVHEGGTLSKLVPDQNDPEHIRAVQFWYFSIQTAEALIGADLELSDGSKWNPSAIEQARREWLQRATAELRAAWPHADIYRVWMAIRDLCDDTRSVIDKLVVEMPPEKADDPEAYKLPQRYGITDAGQLLRICERYKINPFDIAKPEMQDPGMWALLRAQETVRSAEEAAMAAAKVQGLLEA